MLSFSVCLRTVADIGYLDIHIENRTTNVLPAWSSSPVDSWPYVRLSCFDSQLFFVCLFVLFLIKTLKKPTIIK